MLPISFAPVDINDRSLLLLRVLLLFDPKRCGTIVPWVECCSLTIDVDADVDHQGLPIATRSATIFSILSLI